MATSQRPFPWDRRSTPHLRAHPRRSSNLYGTGNDLRPPPAGPRPTPVPPGQLPPTFSAFVVTRLGDRIESGVQTLSVEDLPPGEVVVRVDWSALNYKDGMVTRPGNRVARISPLIPGVDLVGTVLATTDSSVGIGEQVIVHGYDLGVARHGGFSQAGSAACRVGGPAS